MDLKNQTLLIISPHPDDEVLGCGGLIKRIKDEGGKVYVIYLTVGVTLEYSPKGVSTGKERLKEIEDVANFLHYDDYKISFPGDNFHLKLDSMPLSVIINEIENGKDISLREIKPTIIAMPKLNDYNQDHNTATRAVLAAVRPAPVEIKPLQRMVIGYESVPTSDWWTDNKINPNLFISLSDEVLETKIQALNLYKSQVRPNAHPRSLQSMRNLAYYRGMYIGEKAAEAFFCYRSIF